MKYLLLAALLLPSVLVAQINQPVPNSVSRRVVAGPQASSGVLADNYEVKLTVTDKEGQPLEVSVVVASPQFGASLGDQNLSFTGSVTVEDTGSLVIAYSVGWETPSPGAPVGLGQPRGTTMQGSIRLNSGEEVQIFRAGPRIARLSLKKLEPAKAK